MAVKSRETSALPLEAQALIDGLRTAGARPVTLYAGDYCTLRPGDVQPLGYQSSASSAGGSVRQRLLSVVQPPEGMFGVVAAEVCDRYAASRHVGLFVSRLALDGQRATIGPMMEPGEIVQIGPNVGEGEAMAWSAGLGQHDASDDVIAMHAGAGKTQVFAVLAEFETSMVLPDPSLWAPDHEAVWSTFTGRQA